MVNFFRLSKYFIAYIIILLVSAALAVGGLLRPIDLLVYKKFYSNTQSNSHIQEKVIFVELPTENSYDGSFLGVEFLRTEVAHLMDTIGEMVHSDSIAPIVILDISFSSNPVRLDSIKHAVKKLQKDKEIKIYSVYDLPDKDDPISFDAHDALQAQDLYDNVFDGGRLNTYFNDHVGGKGVVSYDSFELIQLEPIPALSVQVIDDLLPNRITNLKDSINYPLPLKLPFVPSSIKDISYVYTNDSLLTDVRKFTNLDPFIDLTNKFIIVSLSGDIQDVGGNDVPGPYLVASALIDQLNGNKFTIPSHNNIIVQLAMVLLFALLVSLIFALIYKYVRKLQTKPYIIAILAFIIGILVLIGVGYAMLEFTIIRPSLTMLSMLWAAVLTWHFTKKFLVTGIMEGGDIYDVFISYSHGDSTWVKKNLYAPLSEFQKPDNSKLKIFFDEKSIGIGELFTSKYMRGIVDSKLFIPVMSEEYYKKNHCRNEMDLAVKRHVEKLMDICIIALDFKYVPEEFTNINLVDITQQSDFMTTLQKELVKGEQKDVDEVKEVKEVEEIKEDVKSIQEDLIPTEKKEKTKTAKRDKKKKSKDSSDKKDKKDPKKKSKKRSDKKDKKEQKKKSKKRSDNKDKKKKTKNSFDKKNKKAQKKKSKKRSNKKDKKGQKKKSKKQSSKKNKKDKKKKRKKS